MGQRVIIQLATCIVSIFLSLFIITKNIVDPILLIVIGVAFGIYILPFIYLLFQGLLFDDPSSQRKMNIWGIGGFIGISLALVIFLCIYWYLSGQLSYDCLVKMAVCAIYLVPLLFFIWKTLIEGSPSYILCFKLWIILGTLGFLAAIIAL